MTINDAAKALQDLKALQAAGVQLPYRPVFIVGQEACGHTVDLATGAINLNGAAARHAPTGQAVAKDGGA